MTMVARHLTLAELETGLEEIRRSPREQGELKMIVRRPGPGQRETVADADLDPADGLVGDSWKLRKTRSGGPPNPDTQLNIMNARAAALVAQDPGRWSLAGDQLFVDLDLSIENLPPGTRLSVGTAIVEVTAEPHTGCAKFMSRFGADAATFVNSPVGRDLNLRGINARVIQAGRIRVGDITRKLPPA